MSHGRHHHCSKKCKKCEIIKIFPEDVEAGDFVIDKEGRYKLCGNVNFLADTAADVAITIAADEVDLDLNDFYVQQVAPFPAAASNQDGTIGIRVLAGRKNVRVHDGWVTDFGAVGVRFEEGAINPIVERVKALRNGGRGSRSVNLAGVSTSRFLVAGISIHGTSLIHSKNATVLDCIANDNRSLQYGPLIPFAGSLTGFIASETIYAGGIVFSFTDGVVTQRCEANGNWGSDSGRGIATLNCTDSILEDNTSADTRGGEGSTGVIQENIERGITKNCKSVGAGNVEPQFFQDPQGQFLPTLANGGLAAMQALGLSVLAARTSAGVAGTGQPVAGVRVGHDFIIEESSSATVTAYNPAKAPRGFTAQGIDGYILRNNTDIGAVNLATKDTAVVATAGVGIGFEHRAGGAGLLQGNTSSRSQIGFSVTNAAVPPLTDKVALIQNTAFWSLVADLRVQNSTGVYLNENNFGVIAYI